jgi:hypothetical protein
MVRSSLKQKIPLLELHLHGNLSYAHSISNVVQMMGKVENIIVQSLTFKM